MKVSRDVQGVEFLILGILIFSLQDVAVKWIGGDYPILEIGYGPPSTDSYSFEVVANQEEVQADEVHVVRLGERQGLADESGQALPKSTVEAFNVVGKARVFAHSLVPVGGENSLVSPPEVAVADALLVIGRNGVPELFASSFTPSTDHTRYDLPGVFAQG